MEGGGEEEAPAAPAAAAQVQLCGAYQQPNEGRAHSCAQCNVNLHSHILCTALWMPIDGVYFCSRSCLGSYNDWAPTTGHEVQPVRQRPDQAETPRAVRLAAPDLAAAPATAAAPLAAAIPRVAGNRRAHVVTTAAAARPRRTGTEAAAPAAAGTTAAAAGTCSSPNAPPPHEHERKGLGSTAMAGQHQARLARGPRAEAAAEAVAASGCFPSPGRVNVEDAGRLGLG